MHDGHPPLTHARIMLMPIPPTLMQMLILAPMPPLNANANANTTRIITLITIVRTLLAGSAKILTMIVTGMSEVHKTP